MLFKVLFVMNSGTLSVYSELKKCTNILWVMEARFLITQNERVICFSRRLDCTMWNGLESKVFMVGSVCVCVCLFLMSSFVCRICPETGSQQKKWSHLLPRSSFLNIILYYKE